ncbi:MAG: hypothetical protein J3K34DRAFT_409605 [Monoraphidium minutum]|nr:MAG: hypothetical protein J3K34DRAFT_409605 [Monoraphidium minutum]
MNTTPKLVGGGKLNWTVGEALFGVHGRMLGLVWSIGAFARKVAAELGQEGLPDKAWFPDTYDVLKASPADFAAAVREVAGGDPVQSRRDITWPRIRAAIKRGKRPREERDQAKEEGPPSPKRKKLSDGAAPQGLRRSQRVAPVALRAGGCGPPGRSGLRGAAEPARGGGSGGRQPAAGRRTGSSSVVAPAVRRGRPARGSRGRPVRVHGPLLAGFSFVNKTALNTLAHRPGGRAVGGDRDLERGAVGSMKATPWRQRRRRHSGVHPKGRAPARRRGLIANSLAAGGAVL